MCNINAIILFLYFRLCSSRDLQFPLENIRDRI